MWVNRKRVKQLEADINELKDKMEHTLRTYNNNFLILDEKVKNQAEKLNVNSSDSELK